MSWRDARAPERLARERSNAERDDSARYDPADVRAPRRAARPRGLEGDTHFPMGQRLLDDPQTAHAPEDADPLGPFYRQVPQPPQERFRPPARQQDRAVSPPGRRPAPFEQRPGRPFSRGPGT